MNQNWDIDRSFPRALHISKLHLNHFDSKILLLFFFTELNKPEYNLSNGDIEKSKPNFTKF